MTAIEGKGLWKFYGDYPALRNLSFTVERGQCLSLLGRNGAGKTTLLRVLAGLSSMQKGELALFGKSVRDASTRAAIGVLGHGLGLYDELTAMENLRLFAKLYELPESTAMQWLERVSLEKVADARVREFSRGMRQRLAVARAFLHQPEILMLDEPFTALDDRAIALLQSVLKEALARGATVVLSTHQLREAMELSTHAALLVRGQMTFFGALPSEMRTDPTWLYRHHGDN